MFEGKLGSTLVCCCHEKVFEVGPCLLDAAVKETAFPRDGTENFPKLGKVCFLEVEEMSWRLKGCLSLNANIEIDSIVVTSWDTIYSLHIGDLVLCVCKH